MFKSPVILLLMEGGMRLLQSIGLNLVLIITVERLFPNVGVYLPCRVIKRGHKQMVRLMFPSWVCTYLLVMVSGLQMLACKTISGIIQCLLGCLMQSIGFILMVQRTLQLTLEMIIKFQVLLKLAVMNLYTLVLDLPLVRIVTTGCQMKSEFLILQEVVTGFQCRTEIRMTQTHLSHLEMKKIFQILLFQRSILKVEQQAFHYLQR